MENEKTEIISAKYITEQTNHMEYQPGMDNIGSEVQDEVISRMNAYDADAETVGGITEEPRRTTFVGAPPIKPRVAFPTATVSVAVVVVGLKPLQPLR